MEVLPSKKVESMKWWSDGFHKTLFPGTFVKNDGQYVVWKDKTRKRRRWDSRNLVVFCQLEND